MDAPTPAAPSRFVHAIRVGWADCDPALIAYTGRIPCFALEAIDAWWEHHVGADWYRLNIDRGVGTPFVHLSMDFRVPLTPRHKLDCEVELKAIGRSSVTFIVRGVQNDQVCFEGLFVSVFVDARSFTKIEAPPDIERLIGPLVRHDADETRPTGPARAY